MPSPSKPFRDPAESNLASYRPDVSEIDSREDVFLEHVARLSITMPLGVQRQFFNRCVVQAVVSLLDDAVRNGTLDDLFDGVQPTTADLDMVTRVLAELIDADNPRLQAKCLAFVLGLNLTGGKSETEIAEEEGVGKAAVSKRCILIREAFGLPPARGMKDDAARESYRKRQAGKRARPPRSEWSFTGFLSNLLPTPNLAS